MHMTHVKNIHVLILKSDIAYNPNFSYFALFDDCQASELWYVH